MRRTSSVHSWLRAQRFHGALALTVSLFCKETGPGILKCSVYENKNRFMHLLIFLFSPVVYNLQNVPKTTPSLWKITECYIDQVISEMVSGRFLYSKTERGQQGEEKDQYVMFSVQLYPGHLWEMECLKNSSPLFSGKGCCNCSCGYQVLQTPTYRPVGMARVNQTQGHWSHYDAAALCRAAERESWLVFW
jgi:hypothetical protein